MRLVFTSPKTNVVKRLTRAPSTEGFPGTATKQLVFIEPPCRATAIYLESESPFVFSFFRVFSVFRG